MKSRLPIALYALFVLFNIHASEVSGASFTPLGDLPSRTFFSTALDVSADGSVVVGVGDTEPSDFDAFRWTKDNGMVRLSIDGSSAQGVSTDGSVVVGSVGRTAGNEAYRWTQASGMVGLGDLPGGSFLSVALAVSGGGSVVVGVSVSASAQEAFRWTQTEGMVGFGRLAGGGFFAEARDVSEDGSVIVGDGSTGGPVRWTQTSGIVDLGDLTDDVGSSGMANGVSADGAVVVGVAAAVSDQVAFRWTETGGMVGLGDLPGGTLHSEAIDVSGDGSVVIGISNSVRGWEPFVWDSNNGMQSLRDLLISGGVDLTGWTLGSANAITADGSTIVGSGQNPSGNTEAWVATFNVPTPAAKWRTISGTLWSKGISVCALVLANGQHMFSCGQNQGNFLQTVPLDSNGDITLFAFADGFAPFRLTGKPEEFQDFRLEMLRSSDVRTLSVFPTAISSTAGRSTISGTIEYNGIPVCALILANGQHMFSCKENLGTFSLDVPLDARGNVRLFAFASGFPPFKQDF